MAGTDEAEACDTAFIAPVLPRRSGRRRLARLALTLAITLPLLGLLAFGLYRAASVTIDGAGTVSQNQLNVADHATPFHINGIRRIEDAKRP